MTTKERERLDKELLEFIHTANKEEIDIVKRLMALMLSKTVDDEISALASVVGKLTVDEYIAKLDELEKLARQRGSLLSFEELAVEA